MDGSHRKPLSLRNCVYNINLRRSEARFQREKGRVEREIRSLERLFKQNVRKVNAAQRGVISMLGHDPYPNCDRDHALFEHNLPGFCYRRNGTPRRFPSLLESKTRKIIHDLEGKEGLVTKPAANIISDSPIMAEVLSSPQIVEILCELRTTAVLISDPALFSQFASSLMKSPNSPLCSHGDSPMECLLQYRKHLIQEFFDELRIQLEVRTCPTAEETGLSSRAVNDSGKSTADKSPKDGLLQLAAPSKEWNEAVIERLRKAKLEEEEQGAGMPNKDQDVSLLESLALLPFSITVNAEDDLIMTPTTASRLLGSASNTAAPPPANTVTQITATQTLTDLVSSPTVQLKPSVVARPAATGPITRSKARRNEFDKFVKSLVAQVENVAEVGKHMGQLQKKRLQFDTVANPLVRLLRKKSLFSSLTEDDLLFYEYDGGRKDAENRIAKGLNMNQPRPGGFTFRVPSRNDYTAPTITTGGDTSTELPPQSAKARHVQIDPAVTAHDDHSGGGSYEEAGSSVSCNACPRSLKRLCCSACNAKIREECNEAQERDRRDSAAKNAQAWKIPGFSDGWTRNYRRDSKPHHLLSSVPLTIRKNYATYSSTQTLTVKRPVPLQGSESSYSIFGTMTPAHRPGAPTPTGRRKNLLPEVSKLIASSDSKSQSKREFSTRTLANPASRRFIEPSRVSWNQPSSSLHQASAEPSDNRFGYEPPYVPRPDELDGSSSWTLKVDRMDITKLRHELESANGRERIAKLERTILGDDYVDLGRVLSAGILLQS